MRTTKILLMISNKVYMYTGYDDRERNVLKMLYFKITKYINNLLVVVLVLISLLILLRSILKCQI